MNAVTLSYSAVGVALLAVVATALLPAFAYGIAVTGVVAVALLAYAFSFVSRGDQ
jgi:hypothetical protein